MSSNDHYIIEDENISIDITMLYHLSGNDESFIHTMIQTFLKIMPDTIKRMEQGMRDENWENVYRTAHFAKSSLSVIKIEDMYNWVVQIEINAKNERHLHTLPGLAEKIKEKFFFAEMILNEKFPGSG